MDEKINIHQPLTDTKSNETRPTFTPEKTTNTSKIFFYVFLFVALLAIAYFGYNIIVSSNSKAEKNTVDDIIPKVIQTSNTTEKNSAGVVLPTTGFPPELLIEPEITPLANQSDFMSDSKTLIATRQYISQIGFQNAHDTAKNYLTNKKDWKITEIALPKNRNQSELEFVAKKGEYTAVFNFKFGDGLHAIVTIVVRSQIK